MSPARFAPLILSAALAAAALPASADGRLHTVRYDARTVVELKGRQGFQSMIQFGEDERVENVAVGDSSAWQVTPNKRADILFVKPVLPNARTNMTVVTDKRTYMFDLLSAPAKATPYYALRFTYPDAPKPDMGDATALAAAAELKAPPPTQPPLKLHYGWAASGDASILPARTYDDGITTYLAWPDKMLLPAILAPGPDGAEGPVNFAAKGDLIQVDQVHPVLILRSGEKRAVLTRSPAPVAAARLAEASR